MKPIYVLGIGGELILAASVPALTFAMGMSWPFYVACVPVVALFLYLAYDIYRMGREDLATNSEPGHR